MMEAALFKRSDKRKRAKKRYLIEDSQQTALKQKTRQNRSVLSPKTVRFQGHPQSSAKVTRVRDLLPIQEERDNEETKEEPEIRVSDMHDPEELARLVTYVDGVKHLIRVRPREKAFFIGRHRTCNFVIDDPLVSNAHGRIWVTESDTAEQLIYYEDTSSHGTLWNNIVIKHQTISLSHGDTLTLASTIFTYEHRSQPGYLDISSQETVTGRERTAFDVSHYRVTSRVLGSGAFAAVRLAFDSQINHQVACKMMRKKFIEDKGFTHRVEQEIRIVQRLVHPNVAGYQGAADDSDYVYLFMDLLTGGDLFNYISRKGQLDGAESKYIMYQLLLGLDYLHNELDLAHRDMKPENVLLRGLGPYPLVLISDFGSATKVQGKKSTSPVGTVYFWSPECFIGKYDAKALDCFATGCVLYAMLSGRQPFDCSEPDTAKHQPLKQNNRKPLQADPSSADLRAKALFRSEVDEMLDTQERIVAKKIVSGRMHFSAAFSSVDKDAIGLIRDMTAFDPLIRYSVHDSLRHKWIRSTLEDLKTKYEKDKQKIPPRLPQAERAQTPISNSR